MEGIIVRPYITDRDFKTLAQWRNLEEDDYTGPGVVTAVAEKNRKPIASVTGTLAVLLSNFLKSPEANAIELTSALAVLIRAVEFHAASNGAVEAISVVSDKLELFQRLIQRGGYKPVPLEGHTVFGIDLINRKNSSSL